MAGPASTHRTTRKRSAAADPCPLDALGPLSSMHAALDAVGAGIPCGITARFEGRGVAEVEDALHRAALHFPLLQQRLIGRRSHPRPILYAAALPGPAHDPAFSLSFMVGSEGRPWSYEVRQAGRDVWLRAIFAHAIADGYSMLHLLGTLASHLGDTDYLPLTFAPRPAASPRSFHSWLPEFLALQCRTFSSLADAEHEPGVAWTTIPMSEAAPLLHRARSELGGFGGLLAASASLSFARACHTPFARPILLNLQVLRSRLDAFNGFGFGAGSIMMPFHPTGRDDPYETARSIAARARRLADEDWDGNLNRLIGQNPRKHRLMAQLKMRRSCDPTLTVSWKSRPIPFGKRSGVRDVACFAASSGTHVSAHLDHNGLSISVTSRQAESARVRMFDDLLLCLGIRSGARYHHLADPVPVPAEETVAPRAKPRPAWTFRTPRPGIEGAAGAGSSGVPPLADPMPSGVA